MVLVYSNEKCSFWYFRLRKLEKNNNSIIFPSFSEGILILLYFSHEVSEITLGVHHPTFQTIVLCNPIAKGHSPKAGSVFCFFWRGYISKESKSSMSPFPDIISILGSGTCFWHRVQNLSCALVLWPFRSSFPQKQLLKVNL